VAAWLDPFRKDGLAYLFILPSVLLVFAVTVYPTFSAVQYSLYQTVVLVRTKFVGLGNYRGLLRDPLLLTNLLNSAVFVFGSIFGTTLLGMGLALLVNQRLRFRTIGRTIIFIPWVTSSVASALLWRWLVNPTYGPLAALAAGVGLPPVDMLADQTLAMVVLVMTNVWRGAAFAMILILAALQTIPENLYSAAAVDGASSWRTFRRIVLPLISPTLLVMMIIQTLTYLNIIDLPFVLTGGGPGRATELVSLRLYAEAFSYYKIGYASSMAILLLVLNMLLTLVYIRVLRCKAIY
jgi:ABC-type sugar transport system permease subunit